MEEQANFQDLVRRVRDGDEEAAAELVKRYEPAVRRVVRVRLVDSRVRRVFDTMDICQSVLGGFFMRVAMGEYDLEQPQQLLALLAQMARNKVADKVRMERAGRRDNRRVEAGDMQEREVAAPAPSPSQVVAGKELLSMVRGRLSEKERRLADLRSQGLPWAEIGEEFQEKPEALRKQLARALSRVEGELGLG